MSVRRLATAARNRLREAYSTLGLEDGDKHVKERFLKLIRKFHPDSGNVEASAEKFIEIKRAYELISQSLATTHNDNVDELIEKSVYDIRHKAPQHRQYLEFEGYGSGTPSQRHKQYQQFRVARAVECASEFVIEKAWSQDSMHENENQLMNRGVTRAEAYYAKKQKTTNLIERMVEDMIQASMKQGGFRNLKGTGKPLEMDESNPYIDDTEMRINKILIRNGFSPLWIMKEGEIRDDLTFVREQIRMERAILLKTGTEGERQWQEAVEHLRTTLEKVNKAIRDFNLIVPSLNRQLFPLNAEKELRRAEEDVETDSKWILKAEKFLEKKVRADRSAMDGGSVFGDFLRELSKLLRVYRSKG